MFSAKFSNEQTSPSHTKYDDEEVDLMYSSGDGDNQSNPKSILQSSDYRQRQQSINETNRLMHFLTESGVSPESKYDNTK